MVTPRSHRGPRFRYPTEAADLEFEARVKEALATSALGARGVGSAVTAIANDFDVSDSAIYKVVDGNSGSWLHDAITWLDAALRAKGRSEAGRRQALAPLLLLVELYMAERSSPALADVDRVIGQLLREAGKTAVVTTEIAADGQVTPEEQVRALEVLQSLQSVLPEVARVLAVRLAGGGAVS